MKKILERQYCPLLALPVTIRVAILVIPGPRSGPPVVTQHYLTERLAEAVVHGFTPDPLRKRGTFQMSESEMALESRRAFEETIRRGPARYFPLLTSHTQARI